MSSELPAPVHVLSKKSYVLRRDTFVFWPSRPVKLLVGERDVGTEVPVLTWF